MAGREPEGSPDMHRVGARGDGSPPSEPETDRRPGGAEGRAPAKNPRPRAAVLRARRRRRTGLILGLAIPLAFLVAVLEREPSRPVGTPAPPESPQLQRGGVRLLPNYGVVAFYGAPQAPELGVLGLSSPETAASALNAQVEPYAALSKKPIYPAFELIATLARDSPGPAGKYRRQQSDELIERYLQVATENEFLLILDIQPGRSDFVTEVKRLRPFLRNPNVGIALDPEWNVGADGVPGEIIGQVEAETINRVADLMSKQAQKLDLPQKLLIVHQFTEEMVQNDDKLRRFPKVALVLNADGFGTPELKRGTYDRLAPRDQPPYAGFKLFYQEDTLLMSPEAVLDLLPRPEVVVYE